MHVFSAWSWLAWSWLNQNNIFASSLMMSLVLLEIEQFLDSFITEFVIRLFPLKLLLIVLEWTTFTERGNPKVPLHETLTMIGKVCSNMILHFVTK